MGLDFKIYRPRTTTTKAVINCPSLTHRKRLFYNRTTSAAASASGPSSLHHQQQKQLQLQPNFLPFIYRLSDDVLLYLLLCPELDFKSLYAIAQVSQRFRQLVCHLLEVYLLPDLQLTTMMDQEGRGRWTCRYQFQTLNETTLCATFTPVATNRRHGTQQQHQCFQRYRSDGSTDAPTLRHIQVFHHDTILSSSLFVKETRRYREMINQNNGRVEEEQQPSNITTSSTTSLSSPPYSSSPMVTSITRQTRRVGIQRCGIRSIKARHFQERLVAKIHPRGNYTSTSSTGSPTWQFVYSVTTEQPMLLGDDASSSSNNSSINNSSMSLALASDHQHHYMQQKINCNKHNAQSSPCLYHHEASAQQRNYHDKNSQKDDTSRYIIPICLVVDVSMLGQRSSNHHYKWFKNHLLLFCWIRRKWPIKQQTTVP